MSCELAHDDDADDDVRSVLDIKYLANTFSKARCDGLSWTWKSKIIQQKLLIGLV